MSKCVFRTTDRAKAFQVAYDLRGQLRPKDVQVQCDHALDDPKAEWEVWLYVDAIIVQVDGGLVQEVIGADLHHQVIVLDWDDQRENDMVAAQVFST